LKGAEGPGSSPGELGKGERGLKALQRGEKRNILPRKIGGGYEKEIGYVGCS